MSRSLPLIEPLESRYAPATLAISVDPSSIEEGDSGTKTLTFKVTLSEAPTERVTVDFFTRNGTAFEGEDFTSAPGRLTFNPPPAGGTADLEQEIIVTILGDTKFETNEDFQVVLLNAVGATLANAQDEMSATATINDNDDAPTISIGNGSISEGNIGAGGTGAQKMTFTVSLSNPSYQEVSVMLNTADGTAVSAGNEDYVARLGQMITFAPGETSKTFEVEINGDTIGETNETFTVTLSGATNGTISTTQNVGTGTINNDDPILRVADVRIAEGTPSANTGNTVEMIFTVTLDRAGSTQVVTVGYNTQAGAGTTVGTDYVADVNGTLTFQGNETSKQIKVLVNKDALLENDETILLNLTNATNAYIEDGQAVGTIANDEIQASLRLVSDTAIRKKENEFTEAVKYEVTLSSAPTDPAGVDVELTFGGSATVLDDYTVDGYTVTDGKIIVHFAPGESSLTKVISLNVINDDLASDDETAQVSISRTTNAVINSASSQGSFTILNDEVKAYLIIEDLTTVTEGDGEKAVFTVRLSTAVEGDVTFSFATAGGTAEEGEDFTSTSGTGKIVAGTPGLSTTIEVPLVDDDLNEENEKFTVQISNGTGGATTASLNAKPTATATIVDDDVAPTIGFDSTELVRIVEGDSGTKLATFKIKLSGPSGRDVTVRAMGVSGTATAGQDFVFDQVITIAEGEDEATFTVPINGDTADEIDENFFVQLSEADGATIDPAKDQAEVSILNDDRKLFIEDVSVSESASQVTFTIRLDAGSLHPVSVKFKTSNGTAIGTIPAGANDDYVAVSGEGPAITFAPGETVKTVTVNLVGDMTAENAETFFGELFEPTNAAISVPKATATIVNDDLAFRISDARIVEGPSGSTSTMTFTVKREGPSAGAVTINYVTQNGTAVLGQDFVEETGTITFADGQTEQTITIDILGDATPEGDSENFSIKLSNPSTGTLLDDTGVGTIVDDEGALVTITDQQIVEDDSGTKQMIFFVTVTGAVNGTIRLNYATEANTASTADFTTTSGTLVFTGAGSQPIVVPIVGDNIYEGDQNFFVKLTKGSTSASVNLVDDTAVGTIVDDEAQGGQLPIVTAEGGKVLEGASGQTEVLFKVKLDRASDQTVTVDFALGTGGTAALGTDYTGITPMTITFQPGQTEVYISVPVLGDTELEADETIQPVLSNATNATTVGGTSTNAVIQNDETLVSVSNGNKIENALDDLGTIAVNLSGPALQPVTVTLVVENGTAILGTDFEIAPGTGYTVNGNVITLTINGQPSGNISFKMLNDTKFEGSEAFTVRVTDVSGAAIDTSASTGTFTINEDEQLTVTIEDQYLYEGETTAPIIGTPTAPGKLGGPFSSPPPEPTVKNVQIKVSLSGPSERAITVKASSLIDGETTALEGVDFQKFTDTEITFAPGETTKTVTVGIIDDQTDEGKETFKISLAEATSGSALGATIETPGTITILDNDLRGISIGDGTIIEGAQGTDKYMTFTVTLAAAATQTVTFSPVAQSSGGVTGATAGVDFLTTIFVADGDDEGQDPDVDPDGVLTFAPGQTTLTFMVKINGDDNVEADESFGVTLNDINGAFATDSTAAGRIVTDEIVYTLTSSTTTPVNENGNVGERTVKFTVTRSFASGFTGDASLLQTPGTVTFTTVDGTAKAGSDFAAANGVLQFPNTSGNSLVQEFSVLINNDTAYEDPESFLARLTASTGGVLAPNSESTVTITSEDAAPTLSIADVSRTEGLSGTSTLVFTVSLTAANNTKPITVNFSTADGSASSALVGPGNFQDYVATQGALVFAPGETTKTITVTINGDNRDELDQETFTVNLTSADVQILDGQATGTIIDDDATPKLTFEGATNGVITVVEGSGTNATSKLKLNLSNPSEKDIVFTVSYAEGSAKLGEDFNAPGTFPRTITIPAGSTSAEVEFQIIGDSIDELNQSFQVTVEKDPASPGAFDIPNSTATITISDDDAAPRLAINDSFVIEGDSLTTKIKFIVTIDGQSDRPITVDFATLDGTALAGGATPDYIALTGELTFQPGETGSKEIEIEVYGDLYKESNENFQVKLSNAVNATIARDTGTGTIQQEDTDNKVVLTVRDARTEEGNSGTKTATFKVELSSPTDTDVVFTAATFNGTAVAFSDFNELNQEFTIPAGSTSVDITVTVRGDQDFEATESFFLRLSGVTGSVDVVANEGRGTIYNDDIQVVNSRMIRYVDPDGDLVTLRITKGALFDSTSQIFQLAAVGEFGGQVLQGINFTGNPRLFNGTSLYVTAEPQPGFLESGGISDGKADVGFIFGAQVNGSAFSSGIDFTNIVIDGDLGGIYAGDLFVTPSIRGKLVADSIGAEGKENMASDAPGNQALFLCKVNSLRTHGDFSAALQMFGGSFGDIGTLTIGGALRGISDAQQGSITFAGTLGKATIGQIIGGPTAFSGSVSGPTSRATDIGSIRVLDGVVGGSGQLSGTISARSIDFLSVGSAPTSNQSGIIGGTGQTSGAVFAGEMGKVIIGTPSDEAQIKGGSAATAGLINAFQTLGSLTLYGDLVGGTAADTGEIFASRIGSVRIEGSVIGGSAAESGFIASNSSAKVNSVTITGDLTGGSAEKTGYVSIGGSLGSLKVGDMVGGSKTSTGAVDVAGSLSKAIINGDLRGGSDSSSGALKVTGNLGALTIHGDLIGGTASNSGQVQAGQLGSARIDGSLVGGSGTLSGSIVSNDTSKVNSITVTESILGGSGERSGYIKTGGSLGSLTVGTPSGESRNLVGGSGTSSGLVDVAGSLSKVIIHGDLRGGSASSTGGLKIGGSLGTVTIGDDFEGGSASAGNQQTGFITADRIARMTINGNWTAGTSTGVADSGSIRVQNDIANFVVGGDVVGASASRLVLAAAGNGANDVAIGKATFGGKVEYLDILGGYGGGATSSKPTGNLVNADAIIKNVTIEKSVLATNIVAGASPGVDGRFGTADDEVGLGTISDNPKLVSLIAKVTIKGLVSETPEAYGIVAQHVKSVSAGGVAVQLLKGERNDTGAASKPIGDRDTFRVVEI